jgi:hypothetical protein
VGDMGDKSLELVRQRGLQLDALAARRMVEL